MAADLKICLEKESEDRSGDRMLEKARESRASKQGLPLASIICREGKQALTHTLPPTYTHTHSVLSASKRLHTQLHTKSRQRECNLQQWRKTWMNPRARKVGRTKRLCSRSPQVGFAVVLLIRDPLCERRAAGKSAWFCLFLLSRLGVLKRFSSSWF